MQGKNMLNFLNIYPKMLTKARTLSPIYASCYEPSQNYIKNILIPKQTQCKIGKP